MQLCELLLFASSSCLKFSRWEYLVPTIEQAMATAAILDLNLAGVTQAKVRPSVLTGILRQLCPRCRSGRIFPRSILWGLPKMATRCSVCGLRFEREEGYFLGAMYISYGLALLTIALVAATLWAFDRRLFQDIFWAVVVFLPFSPLLTLFARVLWIYLDQAIDPERPA